MAAQFRFVDAAVIRVAVFGSELDLWPWPDLAEEAPERVRQWQSWLARVWENEALVEAIEVASPVLARRVQDACDGRVQQPRRVRRVVESVIRYLLRSTSRATPFGLFAGVAALRIGSRASVRRGGRHRTDVCLGRGLPRAGLATPRRPGPVTHVKKPMHPNGQSLATIVRASLPNGVMIDPET